jgi:hypothetical protein
MARVTQQAVIAQTTGQVVIVIATDQRIVTNPA